MIARRDLYPEEAAANAATIAEIPTEQFPDLEARAELVRRALAGYDVYAYRPAFQPEWVVWVRQRDPAVEARFDPQDWARRWRAGVQPIWPEQQQQHEE